MSSEATKEKANDFPFSVSRLKAATLAAALLAGFLLVTPVRAQSGGCGEHSAMIAQLLATYGEQLVAVGVMHSDLVMEIFASEKGETWTVLIVRPTGIACVAASGEAWTEFKILRGDDA